MEAKKKIQKIVYVFISFISYTILFFIFLPYVGEKTSILTLFPIILISIYFGIRSGLFSALILIPINRYFHHLGGYLFISTILHNIPAIICIFFVAGATGFLSEINKKYKNQLRLLENKITGISGTLSDILGLSILLRAVQLHKGDISFNSEIGKGTNFIIKLPEILV